MKRLLLSGPDSQPLQRDPFYHFYHILHHPFFFFLSCLSFLFLLAPWNWRFAQSRSLLNCHCIRRQLSACQVFKKPRLNWQPRPNSPHFWASYPLGRSCSTSH
ncbi:hypothetical protein BJX99DRAFT_156 [Aspergillus californicus]